MTVQDQINWLQENSNSICELFYSMAYKDGEDYRTYELSNIPLDKYQFQLKFKKTPLPVVVKIKSVLGKLIDEVEDGQVTIYGGHAGAIPYWTYKVNKLVKSENLQTSSGNKYKVFGKSCKYGTIRFRTIVANNKESAIKAALYSLEYDNKEKFEFYSIEEISK